MCRVGKTAAFKCSTVFHHPRFNLTTGPGVCEVGDLVTRHEILQHSPSKSKILPQIGPLITRLELNVQTVIACHLFIPLRPSPRLLLALLTPSSLSILGFRGNLPALLAGSISSGFRRFQSVPFCPSEADALNKMTTVICLCHSGPSTDYIAAQKYSARGGGRMCVSAGSNSLFFYFPESCLFH